MVLSNYLNKLKYMQSILTLPTPPPCKHSTDCLYCDTPGYHDEQVYIFYYCLNLVGMNWVHLLSLDSEHSCLSPDHALIMSYMACKCNKDEEKLLQVKWKNNAKINMTNNNKLS